MCVMGTSIERKLRGGTRAIAGMKLGTVAPSFGMNWLPGQDSNLRPIGYEYSQSFDRARTISSPAWNSGEGVGR